MTFLFHLEVWGLDSVWWTARKGLGVGVDGVCGLFQGVNLWKDDGDKLLFKVAECLPNVTLVSYRMNWDFSSIFYFHVWEPVRPTFVYKFLEVASSSDTDADSKGFRNLPHSVFHTHTSCSSRQYDIQKFQLNISVGATFLCTASLLPKFRWGTGETAGQRRLCFCTVLGEREGTGDGYVRETVTKLSHTSLFHPWLHGADVLSCFFPQRPCLRKIQICY